MTALLQGKVAIITGGGRGLGSAIARRFSEEGAMILISGTFEQALSSTASQIQKRTGNRVIALRADVTKWHDVESMVKAAIEEFGTIDILVNNAGRIVIKPFALQSEEDWDSVMDVNAKGSFLCCKAVLPIMKKNRSGKIVNISSQAGKEGTPFMGPYCASKHAVIGLTRSLAKEVAQYGINVNAVCPGTIINTDMRALVDGELEKLGEREIVTLPPLGKFATPEDIVPIVLFLASAESAHMTGQAINVTGGQTQA